MVIINRERLISFLMGEGFSDQNTCILVIWELFFDSGQVAVQTKRNLAKQKPVKCKWGSRKVVYLTLRPRGSVKSLLIEFLNIVELHDSIIVLAPPPLSLPFVKHFSASHLECSKKSVSNLV